MSATMQEMPRTYRAGVRLAILRGLGADKRRAAAVLSRPLHGWRAPVAR